MVGVGTANLGGRYPGPMLASLLARLLCAPTRSGAGRQGSRPPQSPFTGCPSPVAPSPNGLGDDLITEGATCGTAGPLSNGNGAGLGLDFGSSQGVTSLSWQDGQHSSSLAEAVRGWDSPVRRTEVTEAARRSLLGCRSSLPASPDVRASSFLCLVSVRVSFAVSGAAANSLPTSSYMRLYAMSVCPTSPGLDYRLERTSPTDRLNYSTTRSPKPHHQT
ncbi:hypothetical protein BGZ61DRAFT_461370 [Ilyonectria robusta]|uniref:uncharacterized protein n=1 Tax=Ilyonectria robusta TaxID=1079257 RepID=UPI001E8E5347|nr:uncharacterized protein BGZ61DRAFT_461370 [Ilyonectria robusta]KAH8667199.1 hypothetical protein BGZ61DRAFT_461370 [Ilyonectria robusta]